jgi:hypothetical protein
MMMRIARMGEEEAEEVERKWRNTTIIRGEGKL